MEKTTAMNGAVCPPVCKHRMKAIADAMSVLSGKWKFHIMGTLIEGNELGFMELMREIDGIGTKMLSKELQDLEFNQLIRRTVLDTRPVTVRYTISENGKKLIPVINELVQWGAAYRDSVAG